MMLVLGAAFAFAQENITVTGTVTDETGLPMIGVGVVQQGTTNGNITDIDGKYTLTVPRGANIEYSFVGYATQVIAKRTFLNWREKEDRELPTVSFDYDENQTGGEDENLRLQIQGEVEDPERAIEKKETTEVLGKLIADLPHDLKRVLELDQKGYTYDDIAEMEGLPVRTIAQRYKRAVRAIQDMLF